MNDIATLLLKLHLSTSSINKFVLTLRELLFSEWGGGNYSKYFLFIKARDNKSQLNYSTIFMHISFILVFSFKYKKFTNQIIEHNNQKIYYYFCNYIIE